MALRNGISKELRTIVVVPTLLTSQQGIDEQVERLEVHYLANSDDDLRFALVSDWRDAQSESMPGDAELLATAVEGIAHLNKRYGPAAGGGSRSCCFTAGESGMSSSVSGWDGNGSEASCMS